MKKKIISGIVMAVATLSCLPVKGQEKVVPFKYGNMDHWVIRNIKESGIIGGNQKKVYAVGPNMTINGNIPYSNKGGSPWGSSNVLAHVSGIYKTNNSVFRDKHGSGYCAKLVTHIEKVKVLGLINIKVLAAGSLFLGDVREPITSTKDGPKAINWGIPFTARPKALRFDYKTSFPNAANRIKQNGFSGASTVAGRDHAIAVLYLQKRHEDAKGNITAKRVGTMVVRFGKSTDRWVEDATYTIHYGDIRHMAGYQAATMGLRSTDYARNSKGKSVPVSFAAMVSKVKGDTDGTDTWYPESGTLTTGTFDRTLIDAGLSYEYNFWPYGTGKEYRGAKPFTPYITMGLGLTVASGNGKSAAGMNLPLGVGVKYKIATRLNLGVEWTMHFSTSDELDGVKDPYGIKSGGLFKKIGRAHV